MGEVSLQKGFPYSGRMCRCAPFFLLYFENGILHIFLCTVNPLCIKPLLPCVVQSVLYSHIILKIMMHLQLLFLAYLAMGQKGLLKL